ncbi:MAG: response regulator [Alphaproteobacteria bacterium]|nr:response regulator [Alphaproteobacteria bacterium]
MKLFKKQPSVARRAAWLGATYVVITASLMAALALSLRNEAILAGKRELAAFAQLTAGHTFEVAISIEEQLKLTEATLSVATDSGVVDKDSIRAMLRDVVANARGLKDILVLDARGSVAYQANGRDAIGLDRSDQDYFLRFQKDPGLKFDVGLPAKRRTEAGTSEWFIPMAHAWRRANGDFLGVVVGILDPQLFDRAWTFNAGIEGLSIALTSADGMLIMRRPWVDEMMGRAAVDGATRRQLAAGQDADSLLAVDPFDGADQVVAYRRVAAYPNLLVMVARPLDVVIADWRRLAWIVGSCWVVASLALGALGLWLARVRRAHGVIEGRYRALFDSIPYPVIVSDHETLRVLAVNRAAVLRYEWAGAVGSGAQPPYLPQDFAVLAAKRDELSSETATLIEGQKHHARNGETIDVELVVRLMDYGSRTAVLTVAVDVTDRLRAEAARLQAEDLLRQSQKMDMLGRLTGGIAHDFNNILMVIMDNVEAMSEAPGLDPEALKQLDRIATSTQRAEDLTRQMLAFSRKQPLRPRATDVNDVVADTGKLLRRTLGAQIEIDAALADDLWPVEIDSAQLETSLVNLCINARDAMPKGGHVLIETQNRHLDAHAAAAIPGASAGDYVTISVADTGHGILAKDLGMVFEPFFTTKQDGRASGLGLSTIYGFIRQSGGHITVESEVDRGTTFRIYLPRIAAGIAASAGPAGKAPPATGGTERVLVVEDDPQVRASVVRQLQSLGYKVSQANDGKSGLAAFEAMQEPFDLLLTDVVMPGMNGKALADEVSRRWPATRIVFMSGYTDNALVYQGRIESDVHLLSKPFRKSDLAAMLRLALDGRQPTTV